MLEDTLIVVSRFLHHASILNPLERSVNRHFFPSRVQFLPPAVRLAPTAGQGRWTVPRRYAEFLHIIRA
ncbi:MAG: hypothetical protein ACOC37_04665 [Spirochaetota bacterium]